jgi:tetratricopeptide (TPR) repeat protein
MMGLIRRATLAWIPHSTALASAALLLNGCVVAREFDNERSLIITEDGYSLLKEQDYEGAKPYFVRALQIDSGNQVARVDLGLCYQKLGNPDAARAQYLEVIEYGRDHPNQKPVPITEGTSATPTEIANSNLQFLTEKSQVVPIVPLPGTHPVSNAPRD